MTCNGPNSSEVCATPDIDPDQELAKECSRLQTFTSFPSCCPVSALTLARAGFFYTGERDKVKCFTCHATVDEWQPGDSAIGRHKTISPNCRFINTGNFWTEDALSGLPNHRIEHCSANVTLQHGHPGPASELQADYLLRSRQVVDISDTLYLRNPAMGREDARLNSFHNWPAYAPITPEELASAGLYYTGIDDQVACFCCGGKLKNWEPCDEAWSEHRRHFPRCFLVLAHDVGNVESVPHQSGSAELDNDDLCNADLCNASIPQKPSMADYATRIKTFVMWKYLVSKEQLAQAGFYSVGNGDNVVCFHCGGGLQEWKANEDPWEQHARWFPGCKYVIDEKGQDFVNRIHLTNALQDSTIEDLSNAEKPSLIGDVSTEEKLRRLQEEKLCKICMDKTISVVLIPCGHLVACKNCAEAVDKCPLCCAVIANRQKIYMY